MSQSLLKQVGKRQKPFVSLRTRRKLDEQIDIAVWAGLVAKYGSKQRQALDTERSDVSLRRFEPLDRFVPREDETLHDTNLTPLEGFRQLRQTG
jgi:hypothetical protein